jgi:hypothetical protein
VKDGVVNDPINPALPMALEGDATALLDSEPLKKELGLKLRKLCIAWVKVVVFEKCTMSELVDCVRVRLPCPNGLVFVTIVVPTEGCENVVTDVPPRVMVVNVVLVGELRMTVVVPLMMGPNWCRSFEKARKAPRALAKVLSLVRVILVDVVVGIVKLVVDDPVGEVTLMKVLEAVGCVTLIVVVPAGRNDISPADAKPFDLNAPKPLNPRPIMPPPIPLNPPRMAKVPRCALTSAGKASAPIRPAIKRIRPNRECLVMSSSHSTRSGRFLSCKMSRKRYAG